MKKTHVVQHVSRTTGRLIPAPAPTSALSLAQYRRQVKRGTWKPKQVQKQFNLRPYSASSVVKKPRPDKKWYATSNNNNNNKTIRPKSAVSSVNNNNYNKLTSSQRDKITGKIITNVQYNTNNKKKTREKNKSKTRRRPTTANIYISSPKADFSPASSTASIKRPSTAGFHRADPKTVGISFIRDRSKQNKTKQNNHNKNINRPTSATSLSHMRSVNNELENNLNAVMQMHTDLSNEALNTIDRKSAKLRQRPSTAFASKRKGYNNNNNRPQTAGMSRNNNNNNMNTSVINHSLDKSGGSTLSHISSQNYGNNMYKSIQIQKSTKSPNTNKVSPQEKLKKKKSRDYSRPWSANPYLDSPSRKLNRYWGQNNNRNNTNIPAGTRKPKRRPKSSGILRNSSTSKQLKTSAFWGDITKGHETSLEIASKVLIDENPEDEDNNNNNNNMNNAYPNSPHKKVVGLSNAPDNFKFKIPVHSPFNTMPKKFSEYDLHGRKIVEEPTIVFPVDVDNNNNSGSGDGTMPFMVGPDSDKYVPNDSTNSLAMNTLDLYKKNVASDPYHKLLNQGRKTVGAFYNADYFALRRKGQGMVKASIIIPHKYIGDAGFTVGHFVESVDAVDYNADDGCRMYVTLKPGTETKLSTALKKLTKGHFQIDYTKRQYNAKWSYYPYASGRREGAHDDNLIAGGDTESVTFGTLKDEHEHLNEFNAQASQFSEQASFLLKSEANPGISSILQDRRTKEKFLDKICRLSQQGRLRDLKEELYGKTETVVWARSLDGRTVLHTASLAGQVSTVKYLLSIGASLEKRDAKGMRPYDLACLTLKRSDANHPRIAHYRKVRAMTSTISIFEAAKTGDIDRVLHLLSIQPKHARASNAYGMTAMHFAVLSNRIQIARELMQVGGQNVWHVRNNVGQTPLDLAYGKKDLKALYDVGMYDTKRNIVEKQMLAYKKHYDALMEKEEENYVKEYLRGTTAAVLFQQHNKKNKQDMMRKKKGRSISNNKSSYYGKNKSTRGGGGNPYGVPSKIKAVKSTASALDISTIDGGRNTMIRRNKQRNHGFTTQTEKRPWWQRSVTHVFSNVDLEMPDTNTIEFDQYMKNHYNV